MSCAAGVLLAVAAFCASAVQSVRVCVVGLTFCRLFLSCSSSALCLASAASIASTCCWETHKANRAADGERHSAQQAVGGGGGEAAPEDASTEARRAEGADGAQQGEERVRSE